jgi:hypothetical protein
VDLLVEEDDGIEGEVLRGGGHVAVGCQVRQKRLDLGPSEQIRVPHAVEPHVPHDPVHVGTFRGPGESPHADGAADAVEETAGPGSLRLRRGHLPVPIPFCRPPHRVRTFICDLSCR